MHVLARLLTSRPDHLHIAVDNFVIGRLGSGQFPAEEHRRDTIALVTERGRQAVPAAPVLVFARRRSIPGVIIADPVISSLRRGDYDIRAVHGVEVVLGRVSVSWCRERRFGCQNVESIRLKTLDIARRMPMMKLNDATELKCVWCQRSDSLVSVTSDFVRSWCLWNIFRIPSD